MSFRISMAHDAVSRDKPGEIWSFEIHDESRSPPRTFWLKYNRSGYKKMGEVEARYKDSDGQDEETKRVGIEVKRGDKTVALVLLDLDQLCESICRNCKDLARTKIMRMGLWCFRAESCPKGDIEIAVCRFPTRQQLPQLQDIGNAWWDIAYGSEAGRKWQAANSACFCWSLRKLSTSINESKLPAKSPRAER